MTRSAIKSFTQINTRPKRVKNYQLNVTLGVLLLIFSQPCSGQGNIIDSLLKAHPELFGKITAQAEKYRIQIIYTRIDRDSSNHPVFSTYTCQPGNNKYFYCASLVKLPCSILALEKIKNLNVPGLSAASTMFTDSAGLCQHQVVKDTSAPDGLPTLEHYIRKMLLVSDNHAYGRVYEFLGADYIQQRLNELGYPDARIVHRFDGACSGMQHLTTNPVLFYNKEGQLLFKQEQQESKRIYPHPLGTVLVGKAHIDKNGKKVTKPKDFSALNYLSLPAVHQLLLQLAFMPYLPREEQYHISASDRAFLLHYLSLYPRQSTTPVYNPKKYPDAYKKYFIYGDYTGTINDTSLHICNIVGQSFGFMADCAYIFDTSKQIEFMLSAVIYTNENEIINDGKYEYKTIALPYLANLGRIFYQYELKRTRKYRPRLQEF